MSTATIPHFTVCEETQKYKARRNLTAPQIISAAKKLIAQQMHKGASFSKCGDAKEWLWMRYADRKNEVFVCLFLDNKNRLIKAEEMFKGTVNQSAVYPRVVAQRSLELNASAVMFAHNHPGGSLLPSGPDIDITKKLKAVLELVEVRVLDHFIVGANGVFSFARRGMI